ncbi:hypothetical protein HPB47_019540 [Ixodes persulcatus]|uniref:Uncharacterized protein n=1 Tax=Ixodes persulcatus TaxID=34615 RepID=A0AC60QI08_IXOPE|nr:hypothetical protein HPB47_019540 [Ixodes persulcatus]
MAAPLEPLSAQAGRKRFTIIEDILLLREVLAVNPFVNSSRWDTVAANLHQALGRNFSVRGVRDRCDLLLGLFKRDDRTNLRKSGTEEQYTEKEQLLQDVADLAREFCYKVKPVLRKATATEEGATTTSTATLEPPERATATTTRPGTNRAARDAATTARVVAAAAEYRPGNHNAAAGSENCQSIFVDMMNGMEDADAWVPGNTDQVVEQVPAPVPLVPTPVPLVQPTLPPVQARVPVTSVARPRTWGGQATRQKRYREHLGSLEKRAEEDRSIKKLEIALEERRLAMEERQMERRLAIEERQVTLSEDRLAFEREKFYVLQEAAAEERRLRL